MGDYRGNVGGTGWQSARGRVLGPPNPAGPALFPIPVWQTPASCLDPGLVWVHGELTATFAVRRTPIFFHAQNDVERAESLPLRPLLVGGPRRQPGLSPQLSYFRWRLQRSRGCLRSGRNLAQF